MLEQRLSTLIRRNALSYSISLVGKRRINSIMSKFFYFNTFVLENLASGVIPKVIRDFDGVGISILIFFLTSNMNQVAYLKTLMNKHNNAFRQHG